VTTPPLTVNRVCGSGTQAIVLAAQQIPPGSVDVAAAGGMKNMDLARYLITPSALRFLAQLGRALEGKVEPDPLQ